MAVVQFSFPLSINLGVALRISSLPFKDVSQLAVNLTLGWSSLIFRALLLNYNFVFPGDFLSNLFYTTSKQ
jgi:hypothetical protein